MAALRQIAFHCKKRRPRPRPKYRPKPKRVTASVEIRGQQDV